MGKGKATSLGRNNHRFARWRRVFDPRRTSNPGAPSQCTAWPSPHLALWITHRIASLHIAAEGDVVCGGRVAHYHGACRTLDVYLGGLTSSGSRRSMAAPTVMLPA